MVTTGECVSRRAHRRKRAAIAAALAAALAPGAAGAGPGDGRVLYGVSGNATPQTRTYDPTAGLFSGAANTVAGATPVVAQVVSSPTKPEALAGYVDSTGNLRVLVWDGSTWSDTAWGTPLPVVGGNGANGRRFDIAYENLSGDAVVLYSAGAAGANEMRYRAWNAAAGTFGSATNLDLARITGTPLWVKLVSRPGTDEMAAIVSDTNSDLTAVVWSGSAWSGEPAAALSTTLETAAAAGDVDDFDLAYESLSGDLLVVWADAAGTNGTNGVRYATRSAAGTWSAALTPGTFLDDATNLALCSDPGSDYVLFGSIGNAGLDYQHGAWNGTAWVNNVANADISAGTPSSGSHMVACAWLTSGATTRGVIAYADGANTAVDFYTYTPGTGFTAGTDFAYTGTAGTDYQIQMSRDPFNSDRLVLVMADSNGDLYGKRLVMDATPTFTWSHADGDAALTATLTGTTAQAFSFAHDRFVATNTVGNGTDPGNASICPGGAATMLDAFTLQTNYLTDTVTSATVSLAAGSAAALSLVEVTDGAGTAVYGSVANPAGDAVAVPLTTSIAATTSLTQYKVRVTPKTHAGMPAPPGSTWSVSGTVAGIAGGASYTKSYQDTASATVTVDNASPSDATWGATTPGNGQVVLNWTNPGTDFAQVLVLRRAGSAPTEVPVEGATYAAGGMLGSSAVIYVGSGVTHTDSPLVNGTDYYYRIFAQDPCGNWSAAGPVAGPVRPAAVLLTASGAGQPVAGNVAAGTVRNYVGRLALGASGGTVKLTGLTIANDLAGAGAAEAGADVSSLQLFEDVSGNGLTADDKLLGTLSPNGGGAYLSTGLSYNGLPGYDVPVSGKTVVVGLNAAPGARTGRQFAMKVTRAGFAVQIPAGVGALTPDPIVGSTFSFTAGTLDNSTNAAFPVAVVVNPVDGNAVTSYATTDPATASYPGFKVQVQIASPTALTSVVVNYSGTASGSTALAQNAAYGGTATSGIWETSGPVHLRLAPGAYVLQAVATNGAGSASSAKVLVNVTGQRGGATGVSGGDGSILVRDNSAQLCSDCHAVAGHSSQVVGTKYGAWGTSCRDCHTPHGTRNIYLVRESIAPPNVEAFQGAKAVYFSTNAGDSGVAGASNKAQASFANADNTGPCQVCHTRTSPIGAPAVARWRNTGNADTHFTASGGTEACTGCHNHTDGFKAFESTGGATDPVKYGKCSSCHGAIWNGMNGATAKASRHLIGNVAGTNDSYLDSGLTWGSPLSGNAAASRSCVNMCHQDHVHNQPAGTSHAYNVHADATSTTSRQVTRDASGNITAGTPASTDFDNAAANGGMCLSCHRNPVATGGPVVDKAAYNASAHDYTNFSTYGAWTYTQHDTTPFNRNCTKCHADRSDARPNDGGTPFGAVHYSDYAHLLAGTMSPGVGGLDVPANLVCYNCHGNGTTGANLSGKDIATQVAKASGHPANANGALDQAAIYTASAFGNSLGGSGRHAGCSDCHEPHQARAGTHGTPGNLAGPALEGSWGAQLSTNPAFWTAPTSASFTKKVIVSGADLEATLCFKCHSSYYGTLPNAPSGGAETDVALEFNPNNVGNYAGAWVANDTAGGFHPVLATAGSNLGAVTLANLVATNFPWSTSARNLMTCTDCHESDTAADPNGPHGSTAGYILRGPNTTWNISLLAGSASIPAGTFCLNCHSSSYGNSRFPGHTRSGDHAIPCFNCHAAVPHGGPRPGMVIAGAGAAAGVGGTIAGWDTTAPYWQGQASNRLYIASYPANNTTSWAQSNCGCNGTGH